MSKDVQHVKMVLDISSQLLSTLIGSLKDGFQYSDLIALMPAFSSISQLIQESKLALPELQGLTKDEVALLCSSLFDAVEKVSQAVQVKK